MAEVLINNVYLAFAAGGEWHCSSYNKIRDEQFQAICTSMNVRISIYMSLSLCHIIHIKKLQAIYLMLYEQ